MTTHAHFHELPCFSSIHTGIRGSHPEQVFKFLAWEMAKSCGLIAVDVVDRLEHYCKNHIAGMGDGVAMFDWKQSGIAAPLLVFARLEQNIILPALDDRPVDMVVTLISPEHEGQLHLRRLARLSRLFRDIPLVQNLRDASSADGIAAVFAALTPYNAQIAA